MIKKNKRIRAVLSVASFLLISLILLYLLQALLVPKYMSEIKEGAMIAEYYDSEPRHSVLFFGDCEFYNAINPAVIWNGYGITSYVRGSAQQLIFHSYYLISESFEYETPDVVVFNAVEMKIGEVQKETYTRMTLDGMPLSKYKLEAAKLSISLNRSGEDESLASYMFPILRYHSRWSELSEEDFVYWFRRDRVTYNGYLMMNGVQAKNKFRDEAAIPSEIPDICWEYLDKIRTLCKEKGVALIVLKSPTDTAVYPWYDEWDDKLSAYCDSYNIRYINAIKEAAAIGTDWSTDSCDGGDHLNDTGATKLSLYLGRIFSEEYGLPDRRGDSGLCTEWNELYVQYKAAAESAEN